MAYTKYSLTPANNNAAPPDGAPEGMLPSAVNDTMRDMMAQIRDVGDGIRGGTYTMTAPVITGGSITGVALSGNTLTNPVITGGSINNTPIGASTASTGKFTTLTNAALTSGRVTYAGTSGLLQDDADFTFNGTTVTMANDASISGLTVGKGGGAVATNTAVGVSALAANTSGANQIAIGSGCLSSNTTGTSNTGIGRTVLNSNTTGSYNTAVGHQSLESNSTASNNTAVGYQAGYSNTTGQIDAFGYQAGYGNTTGTGNVAFGTGAFKNNTTGSGNIAFGSAVVGVSDGALAKNTTGGANSGLGFQALSQNTTGSFNTALGNTALYSNTTASNNTAVGYQAGYSNTTGTLNCVMGYQAGFSTTANSRNTIIGSEAGYSTTGGENCFVGASAGNAVTTGTANTFVGRGASTAAGYLVTTGSKNTILGGYSGNQGSLDIRTSSNNIVLSDGDGNPYAYWGATGQPTFQSVGVDNVLTLTSTAGAYSTRINLNSSSGGGSVIYGSYSVAVQANTQGVILNTNATSWAANSDERVKDIIEPITDGANKVASLRAVIGKYKDDEEGTRRPFLIAQDVQKVLPEAVVARKDEIGTLTVAYTDVIPLLVSAIQELKAEVDSLKQQLGK